VSSEVDVHIALDLARREVPFGREEAPAHGLVAYAPVRAEQLVAICGPQGTDLGSRPSRSVSIAAAWGARTPAAVSAATRSLLASCGNIAALRPHTARRDPASRDSSYGRLCGL